MTTEIIEGNKSIAEFMGRQIVESPWPHKSLEEQGYWVHQLGQNYFKTKLKYHSSWDWLMPVVEKIELMPNYSVRIQINSCNITDHSHPAWPDGKLISWRNGNKKIENGWLAVIEFITWLKTQTKD